MMDRPSLPPSLVSYLKMVVEHMVSIMDQTGLAAPAVPADD